MADMHTPLLPWRADGDCDDWDTPSHNTAGVSGCAHIVDERGEVVAFAVGVGWNDDDAQRRDLIITAVNERPALIARASQDAETIKALEAQIATKDAALKAAKVVIEMMERPDGMGDEVNAALDVRCAKIDAALAGSAS